MNGDDAGHEESVVVCCRVRPQNAMEKQNYNQVCVEIPDNGYAIKLKTQGVDFQFDKVFSWSCTQKEVYDYAAKPIVTSVLKGFNGTVFAYGQTSSGKTFTMQGPDLEDKVMQGVIPRTIRSVFDGIYQSDENIEFLVKVSLVEIYNEHIRDLLDPKKDNLKIHEDKVRGIFIGDVTETYVQNEEEIFQAMQVAQYNRSTAETDMNAHSSRSHLVFMLTVEQKNLHDGSLKVGKLHMVDLAGSEKVGKTGVTGDRLDEAKSINKSLSALGNVINALTDRGKQHIPYRDSKLTRMLSESLGGNSKTSLIITVSPSTFNEHETMSTLRFGQRAKMIKNVVKVNMERSVAELKFFLEKKEQALMEANARISMYEQLLRKNNIPIPDHMERTASSAGEARAEPRRQGGVGAGEDMEDLIEELQDNREALKEKAERISELQRAVEELQSQIKQGPEESQEIMAKLSEANSEREKVEYERNEMADQMGKVQHENQAMKSEIEALQQSNQHLHALMQKANSPGSGKDVDKPLKHKVSQLDMNLEQLTVMYHKLMAQNNSLKLEVGESGKKIERKEQRIDQLERNLREAKAKYEKLLNQCAKLTASMDAGRSRQSIAGQAPALAAKRPGNIIRPMRGHGAGGTVRAEGDAPAREGNRLGDSRVFKPVSRTDGRGESHSPRGG
mmetsp:Transcript_70841/g.169620  ORF Transcript_70841/g.169620 Transcript_70841/m.169620 type:complete len:674 (-) Transcript_70841:64-2085(-)